MKQVRIMTYIAFILVLLIGFNNVYGNNIIETKSIELAAHVPGTEIGGGSGSGSGTRTSSGLLDTIFNKGKRMARCK